MEHSLHSVGLVQVVENGSYLRGVLAASEVFSMKVRILPRFSPWAGVRDGAQRLRGLAATGTTIVFRGRCAWIRVRVLRRFV